MSRFALISDLTRGYIARGYFPSAVVSVFTRKETLFRESFGSNVLPSGKKEAARPDTVYDMASCTKIATSTQILLQIEEGNLSLDTPVSDVLTEIRPLEPLQSRLKDVTIEKLLTHTSGLIDWYPFYVRQGEDFYRVFNSFIGQTEVMKGMVYSDMNFMLLGKVLEKLKKKDLCACQKDLKALVGGRRMDYVPEDKDNTAPSCYGNDIEQRMVTERGLIFRGWRSTVRPCLDVNDGNAYYFFGGAAGHAGIMSDAESYEKLGQLYLSGQSRLLSESGKVRAPGRGLGWQIDRSLYPEGFGHTGFSGTYLYLCPEKDFGVVALTNRLAFPIRHGTNTNEFRRALAKEVYSLIQA